MRPTRLRRLRRIAASAVLALSLLSGGAFAYWSNTGEANASASLATLSAPTISSATAGAGTVALTWSAVIPPGGGTVEYYVTRDGGAPSGGCPSSSSPSTATSCTDTGVSIGAHEYTVTAVWRTWTATSTAKSVTVTFGPATHLQLEAASVTPTAGEADNLTITAKDASNNTVRTYTGAHSVIFEGAEESPNATKPVVVDRSGVARSFGEATEITFTEGKATVASSKNGVMKLYKAETAEVVVSEGSLSNGVGLAVTVKAAATKKLTLAAPSEAIAGSAFSVTLTATDEYGNPTASYAGAKTLAWSGPANSPSGHAPEYPAGATTVTFTSGVGTASEIDLYDAVASVTLTVKEGSTVKGSAAIAVKVAAAKTLAFTALAEQTAGTAFNATLTAHDEYGNTATGYAGAKTLAWSGPASSPSGQAPEYPTTATTVTFTSGVGKATSIKLFDVAASTLTVKEGSSVEGSSNSFNVKAGATKKFSVPTPGEQEAGVAFSVTLTATDEWGNLATSYAGSKTLTWSEPASSPSGHAPEYPTSASTVTFTAGVGTASAIKLYDAQSTTLKVKEGAAVVGTSGSFIVKAAATTTKFTVSTPGEQTAGTAFNVMLTATDEWGNKTTGYTGSKTLVWSGPSTSPSGQAPSYPSTATTVTFTAGEGTATLLTLYDAQSTTLKAKEGTAVEGASAAFTVKAGAATQLVFTTSPSTPTAENTAFATQPKVTVQDAWQNTAATNTSNVTLTPSGSTLTCTANPKAAVAGVATFAGCKMKTAGAYTLTATDGTLTSVLSSSFSIS
jgi:hypothetical protein